jgi:hypothetical protein
MPIRVDNVGGVKIPEYAIDPTSPSAGDAWVLKSATGGDGTPVGLLLLITTGTFGGSAGYQLSYRNNLGNTIRAVMT